jgi:hypothetical protein
LEIRRRGGGGLERGQTEEFTLSKISSAAFFAKFSGQYIGVVNNFWEGIPFWGYIITYMAYLRTSFVEIFEGGSTFNKSAPAPPPCVHLLFVKVPLAKYFRQIGKRLFILDNQL